MDWKAFLENSSSAVFNKGDVLEEYESSENNWLGYEPAVLAQIIEAEKRLGIILPPSYKDFLLTSNGFKQVDCFLWNFYAVDKIDWLKRLDSEFTDLFDGEFKNNDISADKYFEYSEKQMSYNFKTDYLVNSLAISGWGDAAIVLLNPYVKFGEEWEAWVYANWYPGARRYKSFSDLMIETYNSYLKL